MIDFAGELGLTFTFFSSSETSAFTCAKALAGSLSGAVSFSLLSSLRLFLPSFNFVVVLRLSLRAVILDFVSASPLAMGLVPGIQGGEEVEVVSCF